MKYRSGIDIRCENQNQWLEPACFICSQNLHTLIFCKKDNCSKRKTALLQTRLKAFLQRGENKHAYICIKCYCSTQMLYLEKI